MIIVVVVIVHVVMVMVIEMIASVIHGIHVYGRAFIGHHVRPRFELGQFLRILSILIDLWVIETLYFFYSHLRIWIHTAVLPVIFVLLVDSR
jgi:hypothetical protein